MNASLLFGVTLLLFLSLVILVIKSPQSTNNKFSSKDKKSEQINKQRNFPLLKSFLQCQNKDETFQKRKLSVAFIGDSNTGGIVFNKSIAFTHMDWKLKHAFSFLLLSEYNKTILQESEFRQLGETIFSQGSSAISTCASSQFLFSPTFFHLVQIFHIRKKPLDVAFFMFGTNEVVGNIKQPTRRFIKWSYFNFIENQILKGLNAKEIVVLTPPPILRECPKAGWCETADLHEFRSEVIPGIRDAANALTEKYPDRIRFLDFFEFADDIAEEQNNEIEKYGEANKNNNYILSEDGLHLSVAGHMMLRNFISKEGCG
jgi:lysophospholipase L1-like esterase